MNDDQMVDNVKEASLFGKSDHLVIEFDLRCYANNDDEKPERYLYAKGDYDGLRSDLNKTKWKDLDELDVTSA